MTLTSAIHFCMDVVTWDMGDLQGTILLKKSDSTFQEVIRCQYLLNKGWGFVSSSWILTKMLTVLPLCRQLKLSLDYTDPATARRYYFTAFSFWLWHPCLWCSLSFRRKDFNVHVSFIVENSVVFYYMHFEQLGVSILTIVHWWGRKREGEREGEGGRERECVCVLWLHLRAAVIMSIRFFMLI